MYKVKEEFAKLNIGTAGYAGELGKAPQKILKNLAENTKKYGDTFAKKMDKTTKEAPAESDAKANTKK